MTLFLWLEIRKRLNQFRLVKFVSVEDDDNSWMVLRKSRSWIDWALSKLLNDPGYVWYGTNGRDRGASGCYNYQLDSSRGHLFNLIYTIPEVVAFELSRQWVPYHWFRESLPSIPIVEEVDLAAAYTNLHDKFGLGFDNLLPMSEDCGEAHRLSHVLKAIGPL
jgi:hypothetical protein